MTPRRWIAPAAVFGVSWFVVDHLLPDLLPKPPHTAALAIVAAAMLAALAAGAARLWSWVNERVPRPWFPRPAWRVAVWLRSRPSVSIITAIPKVAFGNTTMDVCQFSLTIQRNFSRATRVSRLVWEDATLVMSQEIEGKRRHFTFRPRDAGGFLALSLNPGTSDAVMVDFEGGAFPVALAAGPDFTKDYQLDLRGVTVVVEGVHTIRAQLPVAIWRWCCQFNFGGIPDSVSHRREAFQ
jgi:hypothetical protein